MFASLCFSLTFVVYCLFACFAFVTSAWSVCELIERSSTDLNSVTGKPYSVFNTLKFPSIDGCQWKLDAASEKCHCYYYYYHHLRCYSNFIIIVIAIAIAVLIVIIVIIIVPLLYHHNKINRLVSCFVWGQLSLRIHKIVQKCVKRGGWILLVSKK